MRFVAHRALFARLGDARFVPFCSLESPIVRVFPPVLLSAFSSCLINCGLFGLHMTSHEGWHALQSLVYVVFHCSIGPFNASSFALLSFWLCLLALVNYIWYSNVNIPDRLSWRDEIYLEQ